MQSRNMPNNNYQFPLSYWFLPGIKPAPDKSKLNPHDGSKSSKARIDKQQVIAITCEYFGVDKWQITTKSRNPHHVYIRDICVYLLRKHVRLFFPQISQLFHRHHSTAMYSNTKVKEQLNTKWENTYKGDIENITAIINNKLNQNK